MKILVSILIFTIFATYFSACQLSTVSPSNNVRTLTPIVTKERGIPLCTAEMLDSRSEGEGGAGWIFMLITYTNITSSDCRLPAKPHIQLFNGSDQIIPVKYQDISDTNEERSDDHEIIVLRGKDAFLTLRWLSICPPETTNDIIVHVTLSTASDIEQTLLVRGVRACDPIFKDDKAFVPEVYIEGFSS